MIASIAAAAAADLESCDKEPIHIPGSIQSHGVLIAANWTDHRVTHVSANFVASTGVPAASAIGSPLAELIGNEAMAEVANALASEHYAPANVLTLKLPFRREPGRNVVVHTWDGRIILELEEVTPNQGHLFARVQAIMAALREINSVSGLCEHVVQALRALAGYDRVMVYRFDAKGNGEVVAEDLRSDMEPYLHLHYPASDIPAQARRLYMRQRVRSIADVGSAPVAILADDRDLSSRALDMSYCGLRSVSPLHIEYLRNMGVSATLAVSLIQDDRLWGMIVCHHLTPRSVPADVKALCDLLGQLFMLLIDKVSEREEIDGVIERQNALATLKQSIESTATISEGFAEAIDALLGLSTATGAAIRLNDRVQLFGVTPPVEETDALMTELNTIAETDAVALDSLSERFPRYATIAPIASGVLFLPVRNNPGDGIVWFRPELRQTVVWGGDPKKGSETAQTERLSPRKSFAAWYELLEGRSAPWTKAETRAANDLGRIVAVGMLHHREARLMRLSQEEEEERVRVMAKIDRAKSIFFANVSHEFRTPLTLMLAPLGDALSDRSVASLPPPQRQRIEVAHRNSLRLLRLVNTLLDFSQIETGREVVRHKPTDLATLTSDLAGGFREAIVRAALTLDIDCPPLPDIFYVDRDIWEKLVLNLISNAFKFTFVGGISVKLRTDGAHVELTVADTGVGIPAAEMPRLFERFHRIEGQRSRSFEGSGIGLALVYDLVRLHGGTVEASSQPDVGTVFTVRVPFQAVDTSNDTGGE